MQEAKTSAYNQNVGELTCWPFLKGKKPQCATLEEHLIRRESHALPGNSYTY